MFGSGDKKPSGVSNWFFSLRRQPKKQKSLDSSKLLQKSCVDLTAAGGASSEQDLLFSTKPSKLKLNNKSSNSNNNNNNNDDALSSASNSCTNCCCKFSSKTSSPSSPVEDIEQCDQMRRVLITSEENYSSAVESHDNEDEVDDIEVHRASTLPRKKPTNNNFNSNILLYNKKEEFTRTTRTVTTKVVTKATINGTETIASARNANQRIGLIFNENGQLMNRRHHHLTKNRDGLIFDECGRLLYTDKNDESSSLSILDDTIEFIDSSTQNSDIQNRANMQHKCNNISSNCSNNGGSKLTLSSSLMSSCKSDWDYNNKQVIFIST